jgi:hypothetical protein
MRNLIAFAFLLTLVSFAGPASAATQEETQACQDDAFKFCDAQIPDEDKVKACLIANMRKLSPACRKMFSRPRRGK